jgi:hypothetical protein
MGFMRVLSRRDGHQHRQGGRPNLMTRPDWTQGDRTQGARKAGAKGQAGLEARVMMSP